MQLALAQQQQPQQLPQLQQQLQQQHAGRAVTSLIADGSASNYYGGGKSNLAQRPPGRASDSGAGSSAVAIKVTGAAVPGAVTVEAVRPVGIQGSAGLHGYRGGVHAASQQQQPTDYLL